MKNKIVWFDFGGVLSPPIDELFDIYFEKTGIPSPVLKDAMHKVASHMGLETLSPIENALITEADWGKALREIIHQHYPDVNTSKARLEQFGEQWFSQVEPNLEMVNEFRRLKENGVTVGILTNNVIEWEPYWKNMLGLDGIADYIVDSCKERRRKPEPEFFYIAEQYSGYSPEQSILIDDLLVNCESAAKRGWSTVHFKNCQQALSDLQTLINI
ncbi:HAD-IA family hydrolase [Photobacterium halotolerans]|uniref:HAD family hydrolase n=1 Tax=Photobacterium halotolerans TaxID=265726 RepID=UPI0013735885|nr:HAD family phosphatase [Photobacterium halotolerans]NAX48284.1 HAD-IA family hydrolase [Photobacterium halotolerans]